MPQYRIPQKTQRVDKIVGPLTGKQLIYGFVTLMMSYVVFSYINVIPVNPFLFSDIERGLITAPFLLMGLAFTFVEFNERPFEVFFSNFMAYMTTPKTRIWQKEPTSSTAVPTAEQQSDKQLPSDDTVEEAPVVSGSRIDSISKLLDRPEENLPAPDDDDHVSSRAYDMLSAIENIDNKDSDTPPINVLTKQKKGIESVINELIGFPLKLFGGGGGGKPKKKDFVQHAKISISENTVETKTDAEDEHLQQILDISSQNEGGKTVEETDAIHIDQPEQEQPL